MRAVLVPVKSFQQAKLRLAGVLEDRHREELARRLAANVLSAAGELARFVVCDDGEVADWALTQGAKVLWTKGFGLSGAVRAGVTDLFSHGFDLVVVAHADLPFVANLGNFGSEGTITLAPDRHLDGTNVAAVPAPADFAFSYGPGSFTRHRQEAERLGMGCRVLYDSELGFDIDTPADLALFVQRAPDSPITNALEMKVVPT